MAAEPLGMGVIGVGAIALRGILPHLTQDDVADSVRVVALCDPVVERVGAAAAAFAVPRAYTSVEEMLADPYVEAVTVASPIGLHFEHVRAALQAGKHVHVNKTLCTTVAEADALIELAGGRGLRMVASPGEVLRPQLTRTRELLRSGAIGDVAWAICGGAFESYHEAGEPERLNAPGGTPINPSWYFRKPGGGPMFDIAVYSLHQLTSVLGAARRVTALSGIRVRERDFQGTAIATEADDNTILALDFGESVYAVAHGTAAGAISQQFGAAVYFGTMGTIDGVLLNGEPFDFPGRELTLDAPVTDWEAQMRVLPHVQGTHRELPEAHVFEDIMQLVDWVRDDVPTPVTATHARHVVDIIESGYEAALQGTAIELRTTFELAEGSA